MSLPKDYEIPVPEDVSLMDHQGENVRFCAPKRYAMIADPPGLGKTLSAIALINCFKAKRVLILCTATLKINWEREWAKFSIHSDLSVGVVSPSEFPDTDVVIVNYDLIERFHDKLTAVVWDFLIIDEAHYLKNPDAKRSKLVYGYVSKKKPIKPIPRKRLIWLTGTPMLNRPADLWPYIEMADPNGVGKNFLTFAKRYCGAFKGPYGWDYRGATNLDELGEKLRAFMIRHDKSLLNLPPKITSVVELPKNGLGIDDLIERERQLFQQVKDQGVDFEGEDFEEQIARLKRLKGEDKIRNILDLASTRQEIALKKLPMVIQFVDDLIEQGEKVIVFTYHRAVAAKLIETYGERAVHITGDVPPGPKRQAAVDSFQNDPDKLVFIGQIRAAGEGITLTAARMVVFAEIDYVPGKLEQAEDRAHRISQTLPVNVYYLVLEESQDSKIMLDLVEKRKNIRKVMEG